MTDNFYTLIGCVQALNRFVASSDAADKQTAQDAASELQSVCDQLLAACPQNAEDWQVKQAFSTHVVTVLEMIETLRSTSIFAQLDDTLVELLEYYYNAADSIMGGGGETSGSGSGSGPFGGNTR